MSALFGETLTFGQEGGPDLQLVAFGDEHYHWLETEDGYTVVLDRDSKRYCYAKLLGEQLTSTGLRADGPPPPSLARHVREPGPTRRRLAQARRAARGPPPAPELAAPTLRTFGPANGLLNGRRLTEGKVKGLTVLVHFADIGSTTQASDVDAMLNGQGYSTNQNACSVREYFSRMSSGKLDYSNVVVGPFKLSRPRSYYVDRSLVPEALDLAVASGVELAGFDSRREGIVDAINILYAGQTQYQEELWPHNGVHSRRFGSVQTSMYMLSSLGRGPEDLSIGTFCHETGHMLARFCDLYDYGNRDDDGIPSAGMGSFCLMGAGNHLDYGRTPAPICAYLRHLAGWCDRIVDVRPGGTFQATHGDYGVLHRYATENENEYFLIENRSKLGLDAHLPSSGLAVYHCDVFGSNEWQEGAPIRHYQCALLQADGRLDLERNANRGDGGDLFGRTAGTALSHATSPASRRWDGQDSGLVVSAITPPGESVAFTIGATAVATDALKGSATMLPVEIPDDDERGISSAIALEHPGIVRRLVTRISIRHDYIGDLRVELLSPRGRRAILHARLGGSDDDLRCTYDSATPGSPLEGLAGEAIAGSWILRIADLAARDAGRLERWEIEVYPA